MRLVLLKGQGDLVLFADVADSPPATQSNVSPQLRTIDVVPQDINDGSIWKDVEAIEETREAMPSKIVQYWISALCIRLSIKHLFSLYWIWIPPAYPLFSKEHLIKDYVSDIERHCSAFLLAAVCAAACDLSHYFLDKRIRKGFQHGSPQAEPRV